MNNSEWIKIDRNDKRTLPKVGQRVRTFRCGHEFEAVFNCYTPRHEEGVFQTILEGGLFGWIEEPEYWALSIDTKPNNFREWLEIELCRTENGIMGRDKSIRQSTLIECLSIIEKMNW